ncbi:MAG: hydrolase [Acidobacteria bacterium]|nr:hydrolase [Acidobacteriota bacterium]MBV9925283.1 hydrolase [Acidobacteriota bacterium]
MSRLNRADAVLLVIDVQERLMPVIHEHEEVERNVDRLLRGARILDLPALVTEQYPKGLGATVEPVRRALLETYGYRPIEKSCFSAWGCGELHAELRTLRRKQVLLAGVEAHVCVYQTAVDLVANGHEVFLIADAISSRTARNRDLALQRMLTEGAKLASTEMALFELLVEAGTEEFRAISRLVK